MTRRRRHHYEVPSNVHSTDEMRANIALAVTLAVVIAGLALANILLASVVTPLSAFMVVAQP